MRTPTGLNTEGSAVSPLTERIRGKITGRHLFSFTPINLGDY